MLKIVWSEIIAMLRRNLKFYSHFLDNIKRGPRRQQEKGAE